MHIDAVEPFVIIPQGVNPLTTDNTFGKVLPFRHPKKDTNQVGDHLVEKQITDAMTSGQAQLLGTVSRDGLLYDFYRLDLNGQITYIFDVKL